MSKQHNKSTKSAPLLQVVQANSIVHGDQMIGPDLASWIIRECFYAPQKDRMERAAVFVARHVENLRRGYWTDYSQITFARLPNGKLVLVNGYHRTSAIIEYGRPALFNVVIVDCDDESEIGSLYARFDRYGIQRIRTTNQALNAVDLAGRLGVKKFVAEAIFNAVPIINNHMSVPTRADEMSTVEMSIIDVRCDAAHDFEREAKLIEIAMEGGRWQIKKRVLAGSVAAVMIQTFRYCPDKAALFWSRVVTNDGLRKGSPENTFVEALLNRSFGGRGNELMIAAALAWNAFYYNKSITALKVGAVNELRILGTPVGKKSAQ